MKFTNPFTAFFLEKCFTVLFATPGNYQHTIKMGEQDNRAINWTTETVQVSLKGQKGWDPNLLWQDV